MTLRLHWSPDSANLAVRISLEAFRLPYQQIRVNRGRAEHKDESYLRLNPQGLLPVLEDGDLVLFETGAILWHIADRAGKLGPEGPVVDEPQSRAAALKWMFFLSNTLHADLRTAFYAHRYVLNQDSVPSLLAGLSQRIHGHCDLIESQLKSGWLIHSTPTIADIYLAVCLRWAQIYPPGATPLRNLSRWPALLSLATRIEQMPAARHAFEAEFIHPELALSSPRPPLLSQEEITGSI